MANPTLVGNIYSALVDGSSNPILSTELNSLAAGSAAIGSVFNSTGVFANQSGFNAVGSGVAIAAGQGTPTAIARLKVTPTSGTWTAGDYAILWLLTELDGANFSGGSTSIPPAVAPACIFPFRAVSTVDYIDVPIFNFPICSAIKALLQSKTASIAFAASANTLNIYPVTDTYPSV